MKVMLKFVLCMKCMFLIPIGLSAQEDGASEQATRYLAELEEYIGAEASSGGDDPVRLARHAAAAKMLEAFREATGDGNWGKAVSELETLSHLGIGGAEFQEWCEEACEKLRLASKAQDIDLSQYRDVIVSAVAPEDLDSVIEVLGAKLSDAGSATQYRGAMSPELQFVVQWQDYLGHRARNDEQGAARVMQSLASAHPVNPIGIPRSVMLRLASYPPAVGGDDSDFESPEVLLAKIGGLEDLPQVLPPLLSLINRSEFNNYRSVVQALEQINKLKLQHDSGLTVTVGMRNAYSDPEGKVMLLWAELIRATLPRRLGVEGEIEFEENESISSYLGRLTREALEAEDYGLAMRAIEERYQLLMSNSSSSSSSSDLDLKALKELQNARNHQQAFQYSMAVKSYLTCLETASSIVPIDKIREELLKIESEQEDSYKYGLGLALNSPYRSSRYSTSALRSMPLPVRNSPGTSSSLEDAEIGKTQATGSKGDSEGGGDGSKEKVSNGDVDEPNKRGGSEPAD
ncbi:MAG: hypothetical protein AAF591_13955 [Verrucomicrobiota bacterium]